MKRLRTQITDKKVTIHSLRHRMKDKLRNTGCPEAISLAILESTAPTQSLPNGAYGAVAGGVMAKWTSGRSEQTLNQSAANGRKEPILLKNSEFQISQISDNNPL